MSVETEQMRIRHFQVMEGKLIFSNKRVKWAIIVALVGSLLAHILLLNRKFEMLTLLHVMWMCTILFLIFTKHRNALLNMRLWVITALIASPLFRMAGRFLNEAIQKSAELQVEFYLYRLLSVLIGLVILNWIRNTIKVEKAGFLRLLNNAMC